MTPEQIKERNFNIMIAIYAIIVTYIAVGLYWGFVPVDLGNNIFHVKEGLIFPPGDAFIQMTKDISAIYIYFATIIGALGALVSIGTRNIFEILLLFWTGMLPRERKYWGVVFDQDSGRPISFVPVRLFEYHEGQGKLLSEAHTDADGRYRLHISKKDIKQDQARYTIEIQYPGYQPVTHDVAQYLVIGNYELISDIPLHKDSSMAGRLREWFFYNRPRIYNALFWTIFYSYLILFVINLIFLINGPIFINVFGVIIIGITAVWNIRIMRRRFKPLIGKVVDIDVKQPVSTALVNVYTNEGQSVSAVTDQNGVVKLDIPSGIYKALASADGYMMLGSDEKGMKLVKIGKDGYIDKDILLQKTGQQVVETGNNMLNPFK